MSIRYFLVVVLSLMVANAAAQSGGARPATAETQQQARAAIAFANATAAPGTPEHLQAFKAALTLARSEIRADKPPTAARALLGRGIGALTPGLGNIDLDPRYGLLVARFQQDQTMIWGGEEVAAGEDQDVVLLTGQGGLCSGTLISSTIVLTAAHCACGRPQQAIFGDSLNRPQDTIAVGTPRSMIRCNQDLKNGDVGVVTLARPVAVQPRRFAPAALVDRAERVRLVGFGLTEDPRVPAGTKRWVDAPVPSPACTGTVQTRNGPIAAAAYYGCTTGQELVAGSPGLNKDTCNGDSGGPALVQDASGQMLLAAVTSRPTGARPCGDGGIYVRITPAVTSWLRSVGASVTF